MKVSQYDYILSRGKGARPEFRRIDKQKLSQTNSTASESETQVLLRSGFSQMVPDAPDQSFALSAALQLNGDFCSLTDEQLSLFAEAELRKKNLSTLKNYTISPDKNVCVISRDPDRLSSFIDTYGGLIEIEPFYLGASHPEYRSVTEYKINSKGNTYVIDYSIRSPLDKEKCIYCGACGIACPEKCISETLYFDFNTCTFCRDCEAACPEKCIDVNAIEQKVLTIPAIIILDGTNVELPENGNRIYRETETDTYFSSLFPCQVEETLQGNFSICQHTALGTGCSKCLDICPNQFYKDYQRSYRYRSSQLH